MSTEHPKVWFITGASRGLGAAIARQALAAGDAVVATGRDPAAVARALGDHPMLRVQPLDVAQEDQARAAVDAALARFGRIDVLVNNAGFGVLGAVEETGADEVERVFRTNVFGLLHVTRAVLPPMRSQGSGHVINVSSIGGYAASPGWGVYCATKFAVEGLSEALAAELEPLGLHATVIEPGFFRTGFLGRESLVPTAVSIDAYDATAGLTRRRAAAADQQQPGDPERLAQSVVALARLASPPRRLAFGSDTVRRIEEKNAFVAAELARWRTWSVSTDFATP